ncbi:MAG: hypothetical protein LUB59_00210 [Candidatus Gastranaerophilales bacterium]|nr:hypothetical protein [Candidatus Gastranaerophilales bacterium]
MNVNGISSIGFKSDNNSIKTIDKKNRLTDNFQTKLRNEADMNDCISVPRTIFKGYLGVMIGTTLGSIASLMKPSKVKTATALAGILTGLYGTWSFVRPYVIKDAVPTIKVGKS